MQKTTTACSSTDGRELGVGKQRGGGEPKDPQNSDSSYCHRCYEIPFRNDSRYNNGGPPFSDLHTNFTPATITPNDDRLINIVCLKFYTIRSLYGYYARSDFSHTHPVKLKLKIHYSQVCTT